MKKFVFFCILMLSFVFLVGCEEKNKEEKAAKLDKVIADLADYQKNKAVRSPNSEEFMPGIYVGKDSVYYYSINKLSVMNFSERVNLLDKMEEFPELSYVVIENKYAKFGSYISIDDIIKNGALAKTTIDLYTIVNNVETSLSSYPNGTTLKTIEVNKVPDKVSYNINEAFSYSGLIVNGIYLDGKIKTETIAADDLKGFSSVKPGYCTITVTVLGRTTTFQVSVANSIATADFKLIRKIDFLKLKQYSVAIKVSGDVDTVILTANGGITPGTAKVVNGVATIDKLVLDESVTTITIVATKNGAVIGEPKVVTF